MQFLPAFIFPQFLICGLFVPREHMARLLQWLADIAPLTYIAEAMKQITAYSNWTHELSKDLIVVACFIIGALLLGALTLRRHE